MTGAGVPSGGRVAVIGAGVAGLTAAHRLCAAGAVCDVYERWPGLGGQAASLDVGGGVLLERYYHHLFPSDRHIVALYEELGMPDAVEWWPSSVAMFSEGSLHPFTTPLDLLRFKPLSLRSRLRMGRAVLALQRRQAEVTQFETESARSWVEREMGAEVWEKVWGPLLHAKFGDRAEELSMAWLWSKLTLRRQVKGRDARRERLGYPRGGWEPLFEALRGSIEARGGRVLIDRPAVSIARAEDGLLVTPGAPGSFRRGHDPRRFDPASEPVRYDGVIATVPCDVFERLLDPRLAAGIDDGYLSRLRSIEYQAALCLLLEVGEPVLPYYWTNVVGPGFPFIGLVEQTNLVPPERYGGRRFLYVANYLSRDDELLGLGLDELLATYEPGLRRVSPRFAESRVENAWVFCEPAAQPVVTVGYHERIPPLETGVPGLLLANTAQVYPEDRGTNYAVRLGDQAAATLLAAGRR
jgi:protoporphyrinogen oxidase